MTFEVPYAPGVLEAVAGDERAVLKTAGAFDHFVYTEETIDDLTWIIATAVDKEGTPYLEGLRDGYLPESVT